MSIPGLSRGFRLLVSVLAVLAIACVRPCNAAYIRDYPVTLTQPDGTTVQVLLTGDEFYNWAHDRDGYVIVRHPSNGRLVYATELHGEIAPTNYVVNKVNPRFVGLKPNIAAKHASEARALSPITRQMARRSDAPKGHNTGAFNNLVIFIRFSNEAQTAFTHHLTEYDAMLNGTEGANTLRNYYKEASYGALTINSTYFPTQSGSSILSFQDSHPRSYYQPYNSTTNPSGYSSDSDRTTREMDLLRAAVGGVKAQVDASGIVTDSDGDGYVDNVVFVVDGNVTDWSSLLWPHMWWLGNGPTLGGATVGTFDFQLENYIFSYGGVGVFCHEMFHSLGAPDLYHYSQDGFNPAGPWDLMEYNQDPPQHMTAFMKWKYGGWISSVPEITESGHYTLNPLTSATGNCFKIRSIASSTQYYMVEYRRQTGMYESSLPGTGLLVYRIDTTVGDGNADGPPDELYIYRPSGSRYVNGDINRANYASGVGRTAINSSTSPMAFLQDGSDGALDIHNISAAGSTISFDITVAYPPATRIGFLTQPGPAKPATALSPQPVVAALSDTGVVNGDYTGTVTVTLKSGSGTAGAVLSGTQTLSFVKGRATFTDLSVDQIGSGYVLTAVSPGLTSADSNSFAVGYPGQVLTVAAQPSGAVAGKMFAVQPVIRVTDLEGHLATTFNGQVNVAIKSGTGAAGALLTGFTSVSAVEGIVSFSALSIDKAAVGYVLTASSGTMSPIDFAPMDVTARATNIVYVDKGTSGMAYDGTSWTTAFRTVQAGINAAVSGDEVWVAASPATYAESITLKAGVAVYGGFTGTETSRAQRNWKTNPTILDGSTNYTSAIVATSGIGPILDGFTVRNAAGYYPGIYLTGGSPSIVNCAITGNLARGASVTGGIAAFTNCLFSGNPYGLYVSGGSASVTNCTVAACSTSGIYLISPASATLTNSIIAFNGTGVGRSSTSGTVAMSHLDVYGNTTANFTNVADPTGVSGNISLDPLFADRPGGDLRLSAGSPCIHAGDDTVTTAGETDLDGNQRIIGQHVDIGAFEFTPFTLEDAAIALQIAGGLATPSTSGVSRLNVDATDLGVDILDAVHIARKAVGLDSNP